MWARARASPWRTWSPECTGWTSRSSAPTGPGPARRTGLFEVREFENTNITGFVWSPDGQRIAFAKSPAGSPANCDLWVADPDLRNARLLCSGVAASGPVDWQGEWILFMPDREEGLPPSYYGSGEYWKISANGGRADPAHENLHQRHPHRVREPVLRQHRDRLLGTLRARHQLPVLRGPQRQRLVPELPLQRRRHPDGWTQVSSGYAWRAAVSPLGDRLLYADSSNYNTPITI